MDENQLQKARRELERDQAEWEAKRTQLEHQVAEHNIALSALKPRLAKAKRETAGAQDELTRLTEAKQEFLRELTGLETMRNDQMVANSVLQSDSQELERIIERKRSSLDNELQDYAATRRTEIELNLTDTKTAVEQAKHELMELTTEINAKKKQISDLSEAVIRVKAETTEETRRVKAELAELVKRRPELAATIKQLEQEIKRAHLEYDQVVAETQKAKVEHENYLAYERKSRKILETKDRELVQRQAEIDATSNRLKSQRSFLTPM